jgi:hypothetical protein
MRASLVVVVSLLAGLAQADELHLEGTVGLHAGAIGLGGRVSGGAGIGRVLVDASLADMDDFHGQQLFRGALGVDVDVHRFVIAGANGNEDRLTPQLVASVGAESLAGAGSREIHADWSIGLGLADDAWLAGARHGIGFRARFELIYAGSAFVGELNTIAITFSR